MCMRGEGYNWVLRLTPIFPDALLLYGHVKYLKSQSYAKRTTKKSPADFSVGLSIKEGSYLLSRIALQYHRRNRA